MNILETKEDREAEQARKDAERHEAINKRAAEKQAEKIRKRDAERLAKIEARNKKRESALKGDVEEEKKE